MKKQWQLKQERNFAQRSVLLALLATALSFSNIVCAYSQSNNFFGTAPGSPSGITAPSSSTGSGGSNDSTDSSDDSNPNAVLPGLNETNPNTAAMGTDFSGDEKRMHKKYKDNLNSANRLIKKGKDMMASAGKNINDPDYKKGKILKETGEKWLVQLKANNPFPQQQKAR
jgi:hypothetical protein